MNVCEQCNECVYNRYPKIPASTPFKAKVAIVGEAPGVTEIAEKQPFVGPAGNLLNKAIAAVGLPPREEIYVTNALLCRPPSNKPQLKQAIGTCNKRLVDELYQVTPQVIIALGNIAMHALTGNYDLKITKEQGRAISSPFFPGTKIVPVLHPAAILRAPGDYKLFYSAMAYAAKLAGGGDVHDPGTVEWEVHETADALEKVARESQGPLIVAADIETTSLDPRQGKTLVLGVSYAKNKALVYPAEVIPKELFEIPNVLWTWHNGKFDISFLRRMGLNARIDHDTMLASYVLNEHGGVHDLEQLASRELGADPYKHIANKQAGGKSKKGFSDVPEDVLFERVAMDADYTRQVLLKLLHRIEKKDGYKRLYYELLIPASPFLRRVERNGMYIYKPLLQELKQEYQEHLAEIMDRILAMGMPLWDPQKYMQDTGAKSAPEVFNPGSTYQLAWLLYDRIGLRPRGRVKGRSTDKEMLQKMQGQHPIIDEMLEYRSVSKELSTYIIGVEDKIANDGRVHTTYKLHGTVTGRLSSSKPNVQNQPKRKPRVRNIFQAPEGRRLLEADYKGAELRVLAEQSKDEKLKQVFLEGRDLHTEVEKELGIPRIRAKAINFGIAYGRTEYSIAEEFEISVEEAKAYLDGWFANYPTAAKFLSECAAAVVQGRTLSTPFGRHRRFGLVTQENLKALQNEARNFIIQSMASDFTLISAMRAEKALKDIGVIIINLVHDSILLELPSTDELIMRRAMKIVEPIMKQVPIDTVGAVVPFEVEFSYGTEWGNLVEL